MRRWIAADDDALAPAVDRDVARACLRAYRPAEERMTVVRDRVIAWLDEFDDALERTCRPGHLTGSALVVDDMAEHVLLHLHAKVGMWLQMGGHCDGDANLAGVAMRESCEESGIDGLRILEAPVNLDVHPFIAPTDPLHLHLDVQFLVRAPQDAVAQISPESRELRWFTWDQALAMDIDDGLRRLIAAARPLATT